MSVEGEPCFTADRSYHLRPSWVRNREVASVETVFDEKAGKEVELITSVDRGYLAFEIMTDSGARTFREVDAADVSLLTTAFDLPAVPNLSTTVPRRIAQHRTEVARSSPFLFPLPGRRRRAARGQTLRASRVRAGGRQDRHGRLLGEDARLQTRPRRLPVLARRELDERAFTVRLSRASPHDPRIRHRAPSRQTQQDAPHRHHLLRHLVRVPLPHRSPHVRRVDLPDVHERRRNPPRVARERKGDIVFFGFAISPRGRAATSGRTLSELERAQTRRAVERDPYLPVASRTVADLLASLSQSS